ncbi:hypothetical protein [Aestuariivirga sp.]|jgi:hypothetical protein|uniref:hypothetical protein n=1 Tax=Aestuariivirga sp. TaxID=2650926 RepID=UPI00378346DD
MMWKAVSLSLLSLSILINPAAAQDNNSCKSETLSAAVDLYATAPFGARSWRVLQGLGDPMIEPAATDADTWERQQEWKKLAAEIMPGAPRLQDVSWSCRIGYPLMVLQKRVGSLGKDHPYVKQWLHTQAYVLQACSGDQSEVAMPPPADVDPVYANLQRMDRAYQEASITFYRDRPKALTLFRDIAATTSPHRAAARYNIANLLANAKQPALARQEAEAILADPTLASVHSISRELLGYIVNQEDTAAAWTELIDEDVATLSIPADRIVASKDLSRAYAAALYDIDFVGIRGKEGTWWIDGTLPSDATISKSIVDAARQHPMALWMIAGQSADEKYELAPWALNGEQWLEKMGGYIAKALTVEPSASALQGPARMMLEALGAQHDDPARRALWSQVRAAIANAHQSCGAASETAAVGFLLQHAVRLSALAGAADEAVLELEKVPFKSARAYSMGAVFPLLQYLAGEGNVAEARRVRDKLVTTEFIATLSNSYEPTDLNRLSSVLALIAEDETRWKNSVLLHSDPTSNVMFNFLPTKVLWSFSSDLNFSDQDRALLARAAWTRDYALARKVDGQALETYLALNPEIRAISDAVKKDYPSISPRHQRLLTILRSPPHNILVAMPGPWMSEGNKPASFTAIDEWNPNDKNWWCPFEADRQLGALRSQTDGLLGVPEDKSYVERKLGDVIAPKLSAELRDVRESVLRQHPMVAMIDWKELRALSRTAQGPKRLSEAAIKWAKSSRSVEDGAAEALALAVRTTRYGCNWHGTHEAYSRTAKLLLSTRFAGSTWQQRTPYWYGCRRTEWNSDFTQKIATCEPKMWPKQPALK